MKRTKNIRHAAFRKSRVIRHLTPVAMAVSAVFMLSGCEQKDEKVSMYMNADQCSQANPGQSAQCTTAYNNAVKEAARTAPKYASREDCVAEFGENQCQQVPAAAGADTQHSSSPWMPLMAGYMMGRMMGGCRSRCSRREILLAQPVVSLWMPPDAATAQPMVAEV